LITSAGSREGKTTIAGNVAASLADLGAKVVLISADLRRPNVHRIFEQEQEPGLSNFLIGEADLESVLRPTKFGQLKVVPSGSIPPNPAELISSARMKALIRKVKEEADYVIVDTAPVLAVSDATILASSVDGVLLVAMAGQTSREALKHSKEALEKVNARVLGTVLNRIDRTYEYGYGYYKYGYGYSYGYYYLDGEKSSRRSYRWVKLLLGLGIIILLIILVQSARFI
jgi:tyrosine-protein kinase Etk/Wzc